MVQVIVEDVTRSAGAVTQTKRRNESIILAGALFIIGASYAYPLVAQEWGWLGPKCVFHWVTGFPCLLCGMTRSFGAMAHLDVQQAFTYHFLGPIFFVAVWVVAASAAWSRVTGKRLSFRADVRTRKLLGYALLGLLIAAWIAKLFIYGRNV